jgi:hypothetical protein
VSKLIILALQIELASLTMRGGIFFGQGGFFCQEREGILNEGKDKIIFFII